MLKKIVSAIAFFVWLAIVTYLSLATFSDSGDGWSLNVPHLDKAVHFIFYFGVAFLGFFLLKEFFGKHVKTTPIFIISLVFAIAYGAIMEILQHKFFLDRSGDIYDALANSVGAFSAISLIKVFFMVKRGVK